MKSKMAIILNKLIATLCEEWRVKPQMSYDLR